MILCNLIQKSNYGQKKQNIQLYIFESWILSSTIKDRSHNDIFLTTISEKLTSRINMISSSLLLSFPEKEDYKMKERDKRKDIQDQISKQLLIQYQIDLMESLHRSSPQLPLFCSRDQYIT